MKNRNNFNMKEAVIIYFLVCVFAFHREAKAQSTDTLYVHAKINKIEKIDYYIVIKATGKNGMRFTILAPLDERNRLTYNKKDSCIIKEGCNYSFALQVTNTIKNGKESYLLINLRKFYYGAMLLLDEGELPYIAINMYKDTIYNQ